MTRSQGEFATGPGTRPRTRRRRAAATGQRGRRPRDRPHVRARRRRHAAGRTMIVKNFFYVKTFRAMHAKNFHETKSTRDQDWPAAAISHRRPSPERTYRLTGDKSDGGRDDAANGKPRKGRKQRRRPVVSDGRATTTGQGHEPAAKAPPQPPLLHQPARESPGANHGTLATTRPPNSAPQARDQLSHSREPTGYRHDRVLAVANSWSGRRPRRLQRNELATGRARPTTGNLSHGTRA